MKQHFFQYLRLSCYVIFPLMVGLCVLAEPLVLVVLKAKWLPAVPYLQILCLAYMWDSIMKLNGAVINAKGRSDLFFRAEIIKKITAFLILAATLPFGIKAMCYGLIGYAFADIAIISHYSNKLVGVSLWLQIRQFAPILGLTAVMGGAVYASTLLFQNPYLTLLIGLVTGLVVYVGVAPVFKVRELNAIISFVKNRKLR
jgi:teichuronic acid exporter